MTGGGSLRYEIQRYQKLTEDYLNYGSTELGNLVLTGNELLDLADAIRKIDDYYEEYEEIKESHQKLIKSIESLFKGKEGSLARKVEILLDEAKENLEED